MAEPKLITRKLRHHSGGRFGYFEITPLALQIARQIDAEESKPKEAPDIVKETMDQFRRNPFMGRVIFWGIAFGTLLIVTNNVITLLKSMGLIRGN